MLRLLAARTVPFAAQIFRLQDNHGRPPAPFGRSSVIAESLSESRLGKQSTVAQPDLRPFCSPGTVRPPLKPMGEADNERQSAQLKRHKTR